MAAIDKKPFKKRRVFRVWRKRFYINPKRKIYLRVLGTPVVGLKTLFSAKSAASVRKPQKIKLTRIPYQKRITTRFRKPKRFPAPGAVPYTRTQSYWRSVYRYYKNEELLSAQPNSLVRLIPVSLTKTGTSLPKWREVIAAGGNATTAFSVSSQTVDVESYPMMSMTFRHRLNASLPYEMKQTLDSSFANEWYAGSIGAHFTSAADQEAQYRATRLLFKKVRAARQQLQGGVILGEAQKTAKLLLGTARNLKQGVFRYLQKASKIRNMKGKSNFRASQISNLMTSSSIRAKNQALSNAYLEAVFGWQPLINDCEDLAKTFGRLCFEKDRSSVKAAVEYEVQTLASAREITFAKLYGVLNTQESTNVKITYRGFLQGVPYEIGSPPAERIISMSGFDLRAFVPNVWELVPYSFLVDYFTNIGDCLAAWTTDTSIVSGLWKTTIKESKRVITFTPNMAKSVATLKSTLAPNLLGDVVTSQTGGIITFRKRDVSRGVAAMPMMVPRLTGLDLPYKQFANIGALLTSFKTRF